MLKGILLYELFHGKAPFRGNSSQEVGKKLLKREMKFKKSIDRDVAGWIIKMLQIYPKERPNIDQILEDGYFKQYYPAQRISEQKHDSSFTRSSFKYKNDNSLTISQNNPSHNSLNSSKKNKEDSSFPISNIPSPEIQSNLQNSNTNSFKKSAKNIKTMSKDFESIKEENQRPKKLSTIQDIIKKASVFQQNNNDSHQIDKPKIKNVIKIGKVNEISSIKPTIKNILDSTKNKISSFVSKTPDLISKNSGHDGELTKNKILSFKSLIKPKNPDTNIKSELPKEKPISKLFLKLESNKIKNKTENKIQKSNNKKSLKLTLKPFSIKLAEKLQKSNFKNKNEILKPQIVKEKGQRNISMKNYSNSSIADSNKTLNLFKNSFQNSLKQVRIGDGLSKLKLNNVGKKESIKYENLKIFKSNIVQTQNIKESSQFDKPKIIRKNNKKILQSKKIISVPFN